MIPLAEVCLATAFCKLGSQRYIKIDSTWFAPALKWCGENTMYDIAIDKWLYRTIGFGLEKTLPVQFSGDFYPDRDGAASDGI